MVLTEPCSHIVATVLSKKLDRSWKSGLTSAIRASKGSPSIQTVGGARSRSQGVQGILLTTCVLTQQQERQKDIKQITQQKGEEKL